jgi:hypothetical protein
LRGRSWTSIGCDLGGVRHVDHVRTGGRGPKLVRLHDRSNPRNHGHCPSPAADRTPARKNAGGRIGAIAVRTDNPHQVVGAGLAADHGLVASQFEISPPFSSAD